MSRRLAVKSLRILHKGTLMRVLCSAIQAALLMLLSLTAHADDAAENKP